jgi:hypothetical protein
MVQAGGFCRRRSRYGPSGRLFALPGHTVVIFGVKTVGVKVDKPSGLIAGRIFICLSV